MASEDKDFGGNGYVNGHVDHEHLNGHVDTSTALHKLRTANTISLSPELFEKLYLSPQNPVKGELRQTFANPTPVGLGGFLLALGPLSHDLMGWRGTGSLNGMATLGTYFFLGGMALILATVGEFIVGNTFPCVVFATFGGFWITYGVTLQPFYQTYAAYAPAGAEPTAGLMTPEFTHAFAWLLIYMAILCFVFSLCALRTNACFLGIMVSLTLTFGCLSGTFFYLTSDPDYAMNLKIAGGAFGFITVIIGWWLFMSIMLAAVDFPVQLPVFDLSHFVKGYSEIKKKHGDKEQ